MSRERAILNFEIAKGMKFDMGHVIESSIIKATNGKCTGGLTNPSTIIMLYKKAGVQFLEFEERYPRDEQKEEFEGEEEDEHNPLIRGSSSS